jgi:hypothetical protein
MPAEELVAPSPPTLGPHGRRGGQRRSNARARASVRREGAGPPERAGQLPAGETVRVHRENVFFSLVLLVRASRPSDT